MIIAVTGGKGGAGKSTAASNIAAEVAHRRIPTILVDADPQGTTAHWAKFAAKNAHTIPPVVPMGVEAKDQIPKIACGHVVVVDGPPRFGDIQRSVLLAADVAVLPCLPSHLDFWALQDSIRLVASANERRSAIGRPPLVTRVVLVQATRTILTREVRSVLEKNQEVPLLKTELGQRVAYKDAFGAGNSVIDHEPDGPAAQEIRSLVDELLALASERMREGQDRRIRRNDALWSQLLGKSEAKAPARRRSR